MQISKESIFSGLNNLEVDNVLSYDFDEMFGFTSDEVMTICEEYGHPDKFEEAKEWYDGYRFGDAEVYNPWSVLRYVKNGFKPNTYWAGTSGNDIIDKLISYGHVKTIDGKYVPNILIVKDRTFNIISNSNLQLIKEIYDLLETVPTIERGYILDQALEAGWLHYDENTPKNVGAFIMY